MDIFYQENIGIQIKSCKLILYPRNSQSLNYIILNVGIPRTNVWIKHTSQSPLYPPGDTNKNHRLSAPEEGK